MSFLFAILTCFSAIFCSTDVPTSSESGSVPKTLIGAIEYTESKGLSPPLVLVSGFLFKQIYIFRDYIIGLKSTESLIHIIYGAGYFTAVGLQILILFYLATTVFHSISATIRSCLEPI
jgi:hypothetical protein